MSASEPDWDLLVAGVRSGDPAAMRIFYDRYGPSLERVAAKAIAPGMLRRFGPESIAHSVCRTFIRRARGDEFDLPDADGLWRLLCAIALNKVRERVRFHRRERRGVDRESHGGDRADPLPTAADRSTPPDEAVAFRDQLEHVLASLDDEERRFVEFRLAGRTEQEIADELGCSERTVRRMLSRLEARLTAALGA